MKKVLSSLENLLIISLLFVCVLVFIKFVYGINHETIDTKYLWNITYDDIKVTEGSTGGEVTNNTNNMNLSVTLKNEGEFYEFTYKINNNGNLNAQISKIDKKIESKDGILIATITYADGTEIKEGDIINSKESKAVKIRIDYPKQEKKIYDELTLNMSFLVTFTPYY